MKHLGTIQDDKDLTHKGYVDGAVATRQEKLAGETGQLLGFNEDKKVVPVNEITNLEILNIWNGGN